MVYWIDGVHGGRLGIMPRPRGGDWLEDEVRSLKLSGTDAVVCLLEQAEIEELEISTEAAICQESGVSYLSFPIPDRDVPLSRRDALTFARSLADLVRESKRVVIHCRQGVGRSALMAAMVMLLLGFSVEEAFDRIERARGCSVPDTPEQRAWVARIAESL